MYAIRSYYVRAHLSPAGLPCHLHTKQNDEGSPPENHEALPGSCPHCYHWQNSDVSCLSNVDMMDSKRKVNPVTSHLTIYRTAGVITSYSIHYTKLYETDHPEPEQLRHSDRSYKTDNSVRLPFSIGSKHWIMCFFQHLGVLRCLPVTYHWM